MSSKQLRNLLLSVGAVLLAAFALAAGASATALPAATVSDGDKAPSAGAAPSGTNVSGTLTSNTTWTPAGSPYTVVGNVTVLPTVTLTISPGVEIDFNQYWGIYVNGTLTAVGTASNLITFTGTSKTAGWWHGLRFQGTVQNPLTDSALSYVTLEYAGYSPSGSIFVADTTLPVSNATIRNGATDGVLGSVRGVANLTNVNFVNNQGYAVKFEDGSVNPVLANLSAVGNTYDAIGWGNGTMTGMHAFPALGIPYVMYYNGVTIAPGGTLVISPGVEIDFNQGAGIYVNGTLTAVGTASNLITFTGTSKTAGWWHGLRFQGTVQNPLTDSALSYVTLEYAGYSPSGSIFVADTTLPVSNATIRNGATDGVLGSVRGVANLTNVNFVNNQGYAVKFEDGSVNPVLANLSAVGNTYDAIGWGNGTMSGVHIWPNVNMPYVLYNFGLTIGVNSTLIISPGVELDFSQSGSLQVYGTLTAIGTATNPITFTGMTKSPGYWNGIQFRGTSVAPIAGSTLSYVTVEYSGYSTTPDVYAYYAQFTLSYSVIRNSSSDGIKLDSGSTGSTIEGNQIVGNAGYGVRNLTPVRTVLAANNWWGDASGPNVDGGCNAGGTGSRVSSGVAFKPFLTSPNSTPDLINPSDARIIQLTPWRWFVPADAVSRAWITVTLTDGAGSPLAGRTVILGSTLGSVVSGGVTDQNGHTLAYITASGPGNADVTASLSLSDACELARSPDTQITFTPVGTGGDLMPNAKAPYLNDGIEISPMPIIQGVPTTIRVTLLNPNAFPITLNGTFGFAQSGIGLTFGPIGQVQNLVIPANGQAVAQTVWTPLISGHYCFRFEASYQTAGPLAPASSNALKDFDAQHNVDVRPAPFKPPAANDALNKARKYTGRLSDGSTILDGATSNGAGLPVSFIQSFMIMDILDRMFDAAGQEINSLRGDPPRQDYQTLATLQHFTFPMVQPGPNVPVALAQALNDYMTAALDMTDKGRAGSLSLDRYAGAVEARNTTWESLQAAAFFYYKMQFGQAALTAAAKLDTLRQELISEGYTDITVPVAAYQAYQQRIATQGYTAQEIAAAYAVGLSDDEIEQIRQETIANDPNVGGGDIIQKFADVSAAWSGAGQQMLAPPFIGVGIGGGGHGPSSAANNLARIFNTSYTVMVGNPTTQTATITLSLRRIDIPSDWQITAPPTLTLPAGGQTTLTVTVQAGTAVVQSTTPSVAIEGYANNNLIGGLVLEVDVPHWAIFRSQRLFLPELVR